jgi:hypothetical protein
MASLLAACRQDFAAARRLHARTEAVRLRAASPARLKCALWQNNPPINARPQSDPLLLQSRSEPRHLQPRRASQAAFPAGLEFVSVVDPCSQGQEMPTDGSGSVSAEPVTYPRGTSPKPVFWTGTSTCPGTQLTGSYPTTVKSTRCHPSVEDVREQRRWQWIRSDAPVGPVLHAGAPLPLDTLPRPCGS